ncbi:MAG TPA: hypothetical protein PKV72_06590 [Candidatus Peribacteria bacterium]|nr:hypothetical protein [Candidatus Peribacteria bacterium]
MSLTLSWDLFVVVFFAIITCYSFIIGKNQAMKVILATYISIIATQGIGNVIVRLTGESTALMQVMGVAFNFTVLSVVKIFLFALFIILFAIRSGIDLTYSRESGTTMNVVFTALFGFATAGLIVSTILTYATTNGIISASSLSDVAVQPVLQGSALMQLMILNQDIWFTLPAFLIIAAGFAHRD